MIDFKACLDKGKAKKVAPNKIRASSLFTSSAQAIKTAKSIPLEVDTSKTIIRELYEGLREFCEALGYVRGIKFNDHESIGIFLGDVLQEETIRKKFDRYRKLRNGINYYGDDIDVETVKEAVQEIPAMVKALQKHSMT